MEMINQCYFIYISIGTINAKEVWALGALKFVNNIYVFSVEKSIFSSLTYSLQLSSYTVRLEKLQMLLGLRSREAEFGCILSGINRLSMYLYDWHSLPIQLCLPGLVIAFRDPSTHHENNHVVTPPSRPDYKL